MTYLAKFMSLEEDEKDLIISFALDDHENDIDNLILLRTLFFEEVFDENERGVKVSLESDNFELEHLNLLKIIKKTNDVIYIKTTFREYEVNISKISKSEIAQMLELLKKQNYDNRFIIDIA